MNVKVESTYQVKVYMSGPIEVAKHFLRGFCRVGLCVTIEPTLFIYTGGEEQGFVVGLLNYPRFPSTPEHLYSLSVQIADGLIEQTHQHSALIVMPDRSEWRTQREA